MQTNKNFATAFLLFCVTCVSGAEELHVSQRPNFRHSSTVKSESGAWNRNISMRNFKSERADHKFEESSHILGGYDAPSDVAKHMAHLSIDFKSRSYPCSGTILSSNVVLTAAHCFVDENDSDESIVEDVSITIGSHKDGEKYKARYVHIFRYYSDGSTRKDLALVSIEGNFKGPYKTVILPEEHYTIPENSTVYAAGYGRNGSSATLYHDIVQEDELVYQSFKYCEEHYNTTFRNLNDFHVHHIICATHYEGIHKPGGVCKGDSGGPLYVRKGGGGMFQLGITSFGEDCSNSSLSWYTNLMTYTTKIVDFLNNNHKFWKKVFESHNCN